MRAALSRRAAAIATVLLFVGGGAASAGLAGVPGLGWAARALADAIAWFRAAGRLKA